MELLEDEISESAPLSEATSTVSRDVIVEQRSEKRLSKHIDIETNVSSKPSLYPQMLLGVVCCLIHLGVGTSLHFSGLTLLQMTASGQNVLHNSSLNRCEKCLNGTILRYDSNGTNVINTKLLVETEKQTNSPEVTIDLTTLGGTEEIENNETININSSDSISKHTWDLFLTEREVALYAGGVTFGAACSTPINGFVLVRFGHKTATQFGLIISMLSWFAMIITPSVNLLLIGRVFQGVSVSILLSATDLYIVEAVHENTRGIMFSLLSFARYSGCVLIFGIGVTKLQWRLQALICSLFTTIPPFILFIFMPTSPRYLAGRGKMEKARKALVFFRGSKYNISSEIQNLEKVFNEENGSSRNEMCKQAHYIIQPKVFKYFIVLLILAFGTQVNGQGIILSYVGPIFQESLPEVNPYIWPLVISIMRVVGSFIMALLSHRLPYRITFLVFNMISVASLGIFGANLYVRENSIDHLPWWVSICSICTLMISTSVVTPVALLMIGEILPTNCRSLGYVITDMMFYASYFILVTCYPSLKRLLYSYGAMWLYGSSSFIISWVPFLFLPETQGKNLESIQMKLFGQNSG